jgi:hypothetical protein
VNESGDHAAVAVVGERAHSGERSPEGRARIGEIAGLA